MKDSRGQTLVLVSLMIFVLLGIVALAIDGGNMLWQRRQMQTAADAGALAGALEIARNNSGAAVSTGRSYCEGGNGAEECTLAVVGGNTVTALAEREVQTFLAGIVGVHSVNVVAAAEAVVDAPQGLGGLLPAAVGWPKGDDGLPDEDFFVPGGYYELWDKDFRSTYCDDHPTDPFCNADDERGSFGWVDWGSTPPAGCSCSNMNGNGTKELSCVMADPDCSGFRYIGEQIEAIGGVRSPEATLFAELWSGDVILLPVYTDRAGGHGSGSKDFIIAGFAAFEVDEAVCEWKGQGNKVGEGPCRDDKGNGNQFGKFKKVTGWFRAFVTPETLVGGGPNLGIRFVHLVQ